MPIYIYIRVVTGNKFDSMEIYMKMYLFSNVQEFILLVDIFLVVEVIVCG